MKLTLFVKARNTEKEKLLHNKEFLILNGALISFLLLVIFISPFYPGDDILLFSSDALTYYNAGEEFFDFSRQGYSWTRPFLYSCFLYYFHSLGGALLIVIFQSIFWIIAGNFIFYSIKNLSNHLFVRIIAVSIFAMNLSLISYIFHGLTEVMATAFLSAITYLISRSIKTGSNFKNTSYIILLFGLLTVIKPLFQYPFFLSLIIGVIIHFKILFSNRKFSLRLLIFITPVLLQYCAMYSKYGSIKISAISELTFTKYIFAQGIREIEKIEDVKDAQKIALKMSPKNRRNYLLKHRDIYLDLYFLNLKDNITGYGKSILLPEKYNAKRFTNFMAKYNNLNYYVGILFLIAFCILFIVDFLKGKLLKYWQQLIIGLLLYYIVFSSGISFWQADRLVLFSLPLWITLYTMILMRIRTMILSMKKNVPID